MEHVTYSAPTIRECPVYLTLGALPAQCMWSNTHFCMCGKFCTKYADVMRHSVKFGRPGDRTLCTLSIIPLYVTKIYLRGTGPLSYVCSCFFTTHCSLRLIVRSELDVPTIATRRLHACHHARAHSGGSWNCWREMSRNFA
jgi:hypothetical protein